MLIRKERDVHKIYLSTPAILGRTVTFRWRVEPATDLYRQTHFTMTFPHSVNIAKVPNRLWWDIFLICLHPHWMLLRPCQVHLPLKLSANERQFWLELLQNGVDTLEANGRGQNRSQGRAIEILDGDIEIGRQVIAGSGYGTAFSGGKDSLLQAAMLFEFTERPLLVTTTSPLPPLSDHGTARRQYIMDEIQRRRDPVYVEVQSDFRSIWNNGFAASRGYRPAVNELTDTFLYMSSLLAVGAALGRTRLYLASEAEVQESAMLDGKIVQHFHFMYSAATQRALSALLAPFGIHFGSLIWPLYSMQVQHLLWTRYPDLCDLQYSCWRVGLDQATCSECEQCLRIAMTALAGGDNPERMGIDMRKVLAYAPNWKPWGENVSSTPVLPEDIAAQRSDHRVLDAIRRTTLLQLAKVLASEHWQRALSRENLQVVAGFRRLRKWASQYPTPPDLGVREQFFEWLDPELRDKLVALYTNYYPREPSHQHIDVFLRSRALTERATSALAARPLQ